MFEPEAVRVGGYGCYYFGEEFGKKWLWGSPPCSQVTGRIATLHEGSSSCPSPEVARGAGLAFQRKLAVPEQPPWGTAEVLSTTVGELLPCGHTRSGHGGVPYRAHSKAQCGLRTMLGWCSLTGLAWLHDTWSLIQGCRYTMPLGLSSSFFWMIRASGQ